MATWRQYEKKLTKEVKSSKPANPAAAWALFRRLLLDELKHDVGAFVQGVATADHYGDGGAVYELVFARHSENDISASIIVELVLQRRPTLRGMDFEVNQRIGDSFDMIPLDEFLDRCYVNEKFHAILADEEGSWTAQVRIEDLSD